MLLEHNLVPTDPRFLKLTMEQIDWLYEMRRKEHEETESALAGTDRAPTYADPDYERWEAALDAQERGVATPEQLSVLKTAEDAGGKWDEELTLGR